MIQVISLISPNSTEYKLEVKNSTQDFFKVNYLHHEDLRSKFLTARENET